MQCCWSPSGKSFRVEAQKRYKYLAPFLKWRWMAFVSRFYIFFFPNTIVPSVFLAPSLPPFSSFPLLRYKATENPKNEWKKKISSLWYVHNVELHYNEFTPTKCVSSVTALDMLGCRIKEIPRANQANTATRRKIPVVYSIKFTHLPCACVCGCVCVCGHVRYSLSLCWFY